MAGHSVKETYSHPKLGDNIVLHIEGTKIGSDIKWNNLEAKFSFHEKSKDNPALFAGLIKPFTHNCGIKALQDLYIYKPVVKPEACLEAIEDWLYHHTNAGMIIGSGTVADHGSAGVIKKHGKNYTFTEETWNPNYTWSKGHNIHAFWKIIKPLKENRWQSK